MNLKQMIFGALAWSEAVAGARQRPLESYRCFLWLEHSLALGTAVHGTPVLATLKAVLPEARIEAAVSGFGAGILPGHPALDRITVMPSPIEDLWGAVKALREARPFGGEPYVVLHSTGNARTRVVAAAALSGGTSRVGYSVQPEFMRVPLAFDGRLSQIENNLRLLGALGHGRRTREALEVDPGLMEPALFPGRAEDAEVETSLREAGLPLQGPLVVFVTQTSPTQRKGWRAERFRQVGERLHREVGAEIIFAGTERESAAIEVLRTGLEAPSANLAGKTTLLQMAALFRRADLGVTLDTGPMHLGRAMRTPMVVIAPAWSPPVEWLPVGNPRARILKNLDLAEAPPEYVIDEVSAEEVEQAALDLLAAYPPQRRE